MDMKKKHDSQSLLWATMVFVLFFLFIAAKPNKNTAVEPAPSFEPSWMQMESAISDVVDSYDGDVGVYIKNLKTGYVYERAADRQFVTASLIKMPIMAATFQAIKEDRLSLDSQIVLRKRHIRYGSGHMKWARVGQRFRVADILYQMISHSDNTATEMLIDLFGYEYLNKAFNGFGLNVTQINPMGMSLSDKLSSEFDNHTTAREMGMLLEKIYDRELVNDGYSDLMMEIMKRADDPHRLGKFLPKNWVLARKTGLLRKNCHDCGIVFTPKGDFIICILTSNNTTYKKAKGFIANIGQTAYEYIGRS
jgi:beta-lactamase class A